MSLSADGSRVAIGAPGKDPNGQPNAGHVRVYQLSSGNWAQLGGDIDGEAASDQSGYSVSLSADGSRVAIGAHLNDPNGQSNAGHVRVFQLPPPPPPPAPLAMQLTLEMGPGTLESSEDNQIWYLIGTEPEVTYRIHLTPVGGQPPYGCSLEPTSLPSNLAATGTETSCVGTASAVTFIIEGELSSESINSVATFTINDSASSRKREPVTMSLVISGMVRAE